MRPTVYAGSSAADALPGGEYAVVYPWRHIETHRGLVPLPPGEPQQINYVTISMAGGRFQLAGQAQTIPGRTWRWDGASWSLLPFVTGQGIFDTHGQYQDAVGGMAFLDDAGRVRSRHETYGARDGVHNWTEHAGFLVGFAPDQGVIVRDLAAGVTRVLESRRVAPIDPRFHVSGRVCAVAYVIAGEGAVVITGTVDELRLLPVASSPAAPTPPPIVAPPPSISTPNQEPQPVRIPNHRHIIDAVSAAHPHLIRTNSAETIRELYWRCAWALHQHDPRWGMLTKSAGENGHEIPGVGRVSVDAVAYRDAVPVVDIFSSAGDGPGTGRITWGVDEHRRESNKWIAPPPFATLSAPTQPPAPSPAPTEPAQASADMLALRRELAELRRMVVDTHGIAETAQAGAALALTMADQAKTAAAQADPATWRARGPVGRGILSVTADLPLVRVP